MLIMLCRERLCCTSIGVAGCRGVVCYLPRTVSRHDSAALLSSLNTNHAALVTHFINNRAKAVSLLTGAMEAISSQDVNHSTIENDSHSTIDDEMEGMGEIFLQQF